MISATSRSDSTVVFTLNISASGLVVYLDNWAIGELAEKDPPRRRRFLDAVQSGVELLFSVTNAAELSGPQGKSADAIRSFLNEIGPRWVPGHFSPLDAVALELAPSEASACISESFLKSFVAHKLRQHQPGQVVDLSDTFFRLGDIFDWVGPQRESIRQGSTEMDEVLRSKFIEVAAKSKSNAEWLDQRFPRIPFDSARPAQFVYRNLLRLLIKEAHSFGKNDALDFCHAVMASSYASFATLDKRWKHKIETLPKPNGLARIYTAPELDQMVSDIESVLKSPRR